MKRFYLSVGILAFALAVPALQADVKTTARTSAKFGGMLGAMSKMFGRGSEDPVTSTVALKGTRKLSMNDTSGEIIDLTEQKVYRIDVRRKEYRVLTFDQVRKEWQEAQAEVQKNAKRLQEAQEANPQATATLEFSADVKETGQHRSIAGYDTREVVLTVTGVRPGQTLDQGGGMVMTNTMWIAPSIPALDEIAAFDLQYFQAIVGADGMAAMQQMTAVFAMIASAKPMMERMQAESRKLEGTTLLSTSTMDTVKSAEEMKAAAEAQRSRPLAGAASAGCWPGGWPAGAAVRATARGPRSSRPSTSTSRSRRLPATLTWPCPRGSANGGSREKSQFSLGWRCPRRSFRRSAPR
jgi:hypothetical protein